MSVVTRPFLIWVTIVVSALFALVAAFGFLRIIVQVPLWLGTDSGVSGVRVLAVVVIQVARILFLLAVTYAAFARPRWGRLVCSVFAVLIALAVFYAGIHPDPHPLFAIRSGAEAAGAAIGRLAMCVLFGIYAFKMLLGARVRTYFKTGESARLPRA